jgi:hypothetical protein
MIYSIKSPVYKSFLSLDSSPVYLYRFSILAKEGAWQHEFRTDEKLVAQQVGDTAKMFATLDGAKQCALDVCSHTMRSMVLHAMKPGMDEDIDDSAFADLPYNVHDSVSGRKAPCAVYVTSPWCGSPDCQRAIMTKNAAAIRMRKTDKRGRGWKGLTDMRIAGNGLPEPTEDETLTQFMGQMATCAHCKNIGTGFKHCSRCDCVAYCSPECQTADWVPEAHKGQCKSKKLAASKTPIKAIKNAAAIVNPDWEC